MACVAAARLDPGTSEAFWWLGRKRIVVREPSAIESLTQIGPAGMQGFTDAELAIQARIRSSVGKFGGQAFHNPDLVGSSS